MSSHYDKIVRSTVSEDNALILQFFKGMVGQKFSFLNYYKEIPISYDGTLLNVDKDMAEFTVHEYQAKIMSINHQVLIHSHHLSPFSEDISADVFYVNSSKKLAVLCRFGFVHIHSEMRQFVRVMLDTTVKADLFFDSGTISGNVHDISISGASLELMSLDQLEPGLGITLNIKFPNQHNRKISEVETRATIVRVLGNKAPYKCIVEFQSEKLSQQQISYYINQRQVAIIKELKDING